jgi:RimJ/RimL family protein N-acetyltransferase
MLKRRMNDVAILAAFRARFAAAVAGPRPVLETARLVLRPYRTSDAADLQRLAGDRRVAATTATIPHPYPDGAAEAFIGAQETRWRDGTHLTCAITERGVDTLVGAVGLVFAAEHARAELGYWIAVPAWGRGYATEASVAICDYGFVTLGLHRIEARHLAGNPASGAVIRKLGMRQEGVLRGYKVKWDTLHDLVVCGVLADEWARRRTV